MAHILYDDMDMNGCRLIGGGLEGTVAPDPTEDGHVANRRYVDTVAGGFRLEPGPGLSFASGGRALALGGPVSGHAADIWLLGESRMRVWAEGGPELLLEGASARLAFAGGGSLTLGAGGARLVSTGQASIKAPSLLLEVQQDGPGVAYSRDVSDTYTDRSLTDKAYVERRVGAVADQVASLQGSIAGAVASLLASDARVTGAWRFEGRPSVPPPMEEGHAVPRSYVDGEVARNTTAMSYPPAWAGGATHVTVAGGVGVVPAPLRVSVMLSMPDGVQDNVTRSGGTFRIRHNRRSPYIAQVGDGLGEVVLCRLLMEEGAVTLILPEGADMTGIDRLTVTLV